MAVRLSGPKFYVDDDNGQPLAGGKVYFYEAGSFETLKDTYTGEETGVANANPVILNAAGYASIYLEGSYNIQVYDADDVLVWTEENVSSNNDQQWIGCSAATYVSPTSFAVTGNKTGQFTADRRVRLYNGSEYVYSTVLSSSFSNPNTTVQLIDASVQVDLTGVCYSIVSSESVLGVNNEWVDCRGFARDSSTMLTLQGDQTDVYDKYRSVRVNDTILGFLYSVITDSVVVGSDTQITLQDPIVTTDAIQVCRSIVGEKSIVRTFFSTVEEMKLGALYAGRTVKTNCYFSPVIPFANRGGSTYLIYTPASYTVATGNVSPDGYGDHELDNGNIARLVSDGTINPFSFGVRGDGVTDDYENLQACINYCQASHLAIRLSSAKYLTSQTLEIVSTLDMSSEVMAGPRIFTGGATLYGGAEIIYTGSPTDRFDKYSYCISVDTGAVGAEGFARVNIDGVGVGWNGLNSGGFYLEGGVDIAIEKCWITGGKSNYDLGTQTGFGIYCKDAIISKLEKNTFRYMAYGIVAENYWNEDVVKKNNFDSLLETCILLRGKDVASVRSTISENNFIQAKRGVVVAGNTNSVVIRENTLELMTHNAIQSTGTDPLDGSSNGTPSNLRIRDNAFIAGNTALAGAHIQLLVNGCVIDGNEVRNPAGPTTSFVNISAGSSAVVVNANDPSTLTEVTGDLSVLTVLSGQNGNFTPNVAFGGASVGVAYTVQVGSFIKIGKLVHVQGQIVLSNKGSSVGNLTITGLPFLSKNTANLFSSGSIRANNLTGIAGHLQVSLTNNSTVMGVSYLGTGALSNVTDAVCTNTTSFYFQCSYIAN